MDYYSKYLKYKGKYQKLKRKRALGRESVNGDTTELMHKRKVKIPNTIDSIYVYFINSDIIELISNYDNILKANKEVKRLEEIITQEKINNLAEINTQNYNTPARPKRYTLSTAETKYKEYIMSLSPTILSYVSPSKRDELKVKLNEDDNIIMDIEKSIDTKDKDYIHIENYGKLIEIWLADNMKCPCCNEKTLKRYSKDNFPIIDLVCINPNHNINDNVKFFQVKTSYLQNNGASISLHGQPYFSFNDKTIMIGSKEWGQFSHNIKGSDDNKKILIGYICILFTKNKNDTHIIISKSKSFVVLPSVKNNDNKAYYQYTNFTYHPQIIFNDEINYIGNLNGDNLSSASYLEANNINKRLFDDTTINKDMTSKVYLESNKIPLNYNDSEKWITITNPLRQEILKV